ncbi:hypothetical protein Bca4012_093268 [Brassica carinata]
MKHLKGKTRNLAKVEGSIVAGSLTAETSNFTSYYFAPTVRTRKRVPRRYDDGGVPTSYPIDGVPDIFCEIARFGGKTKEVWWSCEEDKHSAHTYILLNCEDAVDYDDPYYPVWFHELVQGPVAKVTTSPMYFTRGFTFHTYEYGRHRATSNYGICVKGETDFYGILQEIIEVEFPGLLKIKCVLFKCEWFDPVVNRGIRYNKFGVVDVNFGRRYNKFESFILASQAEQVSFLPYPRLRTSGINWLAAIKITPRGRIVAGEEQPLQEEDAINEVEVPEQPTDEIFLIDPQNFQYEDIPEDATDEAREDEFERSDDDDCNDSDENENDLE